MTAWYYQGDGLKLWEETYAAFNLVPRPGTAVAPQMAARYYYYPGWPEPGTTLDFGFNKKAYEALPVDLRRTLDHAPRRCRSMASRTST